MFILASASPRRKELLSTLIKDFEIVVSDVDENIEVDDVYLLPLELSKLKAYSVFKNHQDDIVLASDTIVLLDNEVLGKPKDKEDAKKMLRKLSSRKHQVITGYTLISKEKEINRYVITDVYFKELSDELIDAYVATLSPLDKAGAYGIQDKDFDLVDRIDGSYSNVMGLPLEDLANYL